MISKQNKILSGEQIELFSNKKDSLEIKIEEKKEKPRFNIGK